MINLIYLFPCVLHHFSKSCDIFFITKLQSLRKTLILALSTLWQKVYDQLSYLSSELGNNSFTWMFIFTQFIDQLPVGLLAQLVERCTGIAEVMGSNPVRA